MQGKTCLITGASRGIGFHTALNLAKQGAHVIIISHNQERCEQAAEKIKAQAGHESVEYFTADLSSLSQIREISTIIHQDYNRLDVLVNNVGEWFRNRQESEDGIEMTLALNHLGYFLLTGLLLDLLHQSPGARIINVTSDAHKRMMRMRFDDLEFNKSYRSFQAYAQSKLANIYFTYTLAERLNNSRITVNAVHPGLVRTGFYDDFGMMTPIMNLIASTFGKDAVEGADTPTYLASSSEVEGITGKYFIDRKMVKSSPASYDQAAAARLWEISEKMTDFSYPEINKDN